MRDWRVQNSDGKDPYRELLHKRVENRSPEMGCAKTVALELKKVIKSGDHILDVGCGAGHYLHSFRRRIKKDFSYTGVDSTREYVELGKNAFKADPDVHFMTGDVENLKFADNSFDIVMCNNLLCLIPTIKKALLELIRVSRRFLMIRTLVGDRSLVIKEVWSECWAKGCGIKPEDSFDENGEPRGYNPLNIYSRGYVESIIKSVPKVAKCVIEPDNRRFKTSKGEKNIDYTSHINGMSIKGYVIEPWAIIKIWVTGR